jgi:hypothetical protein
MVCETSKAGRTAFLIQLSVYLGPEVVAEAQLGSHVLVTFLLAKKELV